MRRKFELLKVEVPDFLITLLATTLVAALIVFLTESDDTNRVFRVFTISYTYGICIQLSIVLWGWYFPYKNLFAKYFLPVLAGFLIATMFTLWLFSGQPELSGEKLLSFLSQVLLYALLATFIIIYIFVVKEQKDSMRFMLREAQLVEEINENKILQSKLRLLQSQIEPHFIFNTLANIRELIKVDPDKSELLLDSLTALLRQSLKQTRDEVNSLKNEISFCKSYLAIQKIRLGSRLLVDISIDEDIDLQQPFPPLLLLPIIENAIHHGIEPITEPSELLISLQNVIGSDNLLEITVSDSGAGFGKSTHFGHGVGLNNIRSRIDSLFGPAASLSVSERDPRGVTVVLITPFWLPQSEIEYSEATA